MNEPGVPGRFLFFLGTWGGLLGLGLGFVFCSWANPPIEVDREKGSPGIICILEKKWRKLYWNIGGFGVVEQKQTATFQRLFRQYNKEENNGFEVAKAKDSEHKILLEGTPKILLKERVVAPYIYRSAKRQEKAINWKTRIEPKVFKVWKRN